MGNNGGREARRKRALGSRFKTENRQTDNHPDCLSVTDSTPHPKLPSRYPHKSFWAQPLLGLQFLSPTYP